MNYSIYDDIDLESNSNSYSVDRNIGHGENYDFCFDNEYSRGGLPMGYTELPYRMDRLEEMIHGMSKKRKKRKKKSKRRHNESKRLKKRLKTIEKQNAYIAGYLVAAMTQTQNTDTTDKFAWLKKGFENSTPQIIDLISNAMTSKRQVRTPTFNQPLSLPDKSRTK